VPAGTEESFVEASGGGGMKGGSFEGTGSSTGSSGSSERSMDSCSDLRRSWSNRSTTDSDYDTALSMSRGECSFLELTGMEFSRAL
jgi:hypothetical protein